MSLSGLKPGLRQVVGDEGIRDGKEALSVYIDSNGSESALLRVLPENTDQASRVMQAAAEAGASVYTVRSRYMPEGISGKTGILIDPARLDYIKRIDPRNMMAYIGAGVTFEQLKEELDGLGLRILYPACTDTRYVVRSYLDRDLLIGEIINRHTQLSVFHAVLADGRLWASGTHQMGEEGHADFREDQGPQFSPFFGASEDIYGVPVYGIVYLFPIREKRAELSFGFDNLKDAVEFSYRVSRKEHCFELAGGDPVWWQSLEGDRSSSVQGVLPPWAVALSLEHRADLVDVQLPMVEREAAANGGEKLDGEITAVLAGHFGRPWYLWERSAYSGAMRHVFCYTFSEKIPEVFSICRGAASAPDLSGELGNCFIPVYRGGAFYCESDIHHPVEMNREACQAWRDAFAGLLERGALVDKPKGELARLVFSRAEPSYISMIKRVKRILDPDGRLNPGQLLEGI